MRLVLIIQSLVHTVAIVLVAIFAQHQQRPVSPEHGQRRVVDTVEHVGLHRGIVYHIFKDDGIANRERCGETPIAHEVAREAGVAAQPRPKTLAIIFKEINNQIGGNINRTVNQYDCDYNCHCLVILYKCPEHLRNRRRIHIHG